MRARSALSISLVFILSACASMGTGASASNPLQGTWELVSSRMTRGDSVMEMRSPTLRSIKVINATHFSFITTRESGEFVRSAAGPYTVSGNQYTENTQASSAPGMRNQSYTFTYRVEGDLWYYSGSVSTTKLDEVWRRVR